MNRSVCAVVLGWSLAACGWPTDDVSYYGAIEDESGRLSVLLAVCTIGEVTAEVTETAGAVRVDEVSAEVTDDDCAGALQIDLDAPLGDRVLIVEGEQWIPFEGTCDRRVTLVPPDIPEWFTDCPDGN